MKTSSRMTSSSMRRVVLAPGTSTTACAGRRCLGKGKPPLSMLVTGRLWRKEMVDVLIEQIWDMLIFISM